MNKLICGVFLFCISASSFADKCKVEYLEELDYSDIECQFYMGTAAYRNEVYGVAAAHWNFIQDSSSKYEGDDEIKAMALGTVTFLYYQGLGVKEDKEKAVKNWKDAVLKGDFEARRHLGFAYSDTDYKHYDLIESLGWYKSIFLVIEDYEQLDDSDKSVYQYALKAAEELRAKLSDRQERKSLDFAKSTL